MLFEFFSSFIGYFKVRWVITNSSFKINTEPWITLFLASTKIIKINIIWKFNQYLFCVFCKTLLKILFQSHIRHPLIFFFVLQRMIKFDWWNDFLNSGPLPQYMAMALEMVKLKRCLDSVNHDWADGHKPHVNFQSHVRYWYRYR